MRLQFTLDLYGKRANSICEIDSRLLVDNSQRQPFVDRMNPDQLSCVRWQFTDSATPTGLLRTLTYTVASSELI